MTDKQIIIHGVDVSECKKYKHEIERCNALLRNLCFGSALGCTHEKSKNCYYKQLKRKEQECEELKSDLTDLSKIIDCKNGTILTFKEQLDQLKTENEQLKEELSVIQHNCNREGCKYYDDDTFKVFYECKAQKALQLSANSVTTKYCDLLQTLTEIKSICNNNDELKGGFNLVDCDKYKLGKHNLAQKIIAKINEVLNDK